MKLSNIHRNECNFSLLEVLIVLFITSLLLSFLLPIISLAQSKTQQIKCANNYKQIFTLMNLYSVDNNGYLPRTNHSDYYHGTIVGHPSYPTVPIKKPSGNTMGWHGHLAPYIYQMDNNNWNLYSGSLFMKAVYSNESNPWKLFICPSAHNEKRVSRIKTAYSSLYLHGLPFSYMANANFVGRGLTWQNNIKSVRFEEIEDPSGKILLFEASPFIPGNPTYDRVWNAKQLLKISFSAADDPLWLTPGVVYPEGDPGMWGYTQYRNHHGAMHFLHDIDNSFSEGYQNNLFADGSVHRKHEWWLYLNANELGEIKGKGIN